MKNQINNFSRRDFVKVSSAALISIPFMGYSNNIFNTGDFVNPSLNVNVFSKHLQFLNYENMSEAAAEIGFDGIDLTVRPGGHVLPQNVNTDLPKAIEAMKKFGLKPNMMTTEVTNADDPVNINLLETASALGFKYYRMGWVKYPESISIPKALEGYNNQFKVLAALNKKLGLKGAYQNHAGKYVGAPVWDIYQILKGISSDECGCQYDIRHAAVEGANSWELGLNLIKDHINSIVIKDFKWEFQNGKWVIINTPLGEGMVDFERYFSLLKSYRINVPVSLHFEYDMGGVEHGNKVLTIEKTEVFRKMKKDLQFLRAKWKMVP